MPAAPLPAPVRFENPVNIGAPQLREALDRALARDYSNLEVLTSENASTEGTIDISMHYLNKATPERQMEYPILVPVLGLVRIVALPKFLLVYRRSTDSSWHRECDRLSGLDRLLLGLHTKWFLLKTAWRFPLPLAEKVSLLGLTLRNFLK